MKKNRRNIDAIYPLSPLQQGMLFHTQSDPEGGWYIEQSVQEFTGNIDRNALKTAWKSLIQRHAVFRTLFIKLDTDNPLQVVSKQVVLPWQEQDWRVHSSEKQKQQLESWLDTDRRQGFALNKPPLMRLTLFQLEADRYYFIWSFHHALLDGWSTSTVFKELFTLYNAAQQGHTLTLPHITSYQQYILWLTKKNKTSAENYWREYLQGFSTPTPLMTDRRLTKDATSHNITPTKHQGALSVTVTAALQNLSRQEKITLNVVMQCVWGLLLSRYSGENDIVFGQVVSGRTADISGVETIVGPLINTIPTRIKIDPEAKILPWLRQQHYAQTESIQYEHTPLIDIQRWSEVSADIGLFQSLYVFENHSPPTRSDKPDTDTTFKVTGGNLHERNNYPISIMVGPGNAITFQIDYDPARFNQETIERLAQHYQQLLEGIAENPQQKLSELTLLSNAERQQILYGWNDTQTNYPQDKCIHQLFEEQVERTPNEVSIIYEEQKLTYEELNQQSNQLAHYLIEQGINPENRVALCLVRSFEMIIGVLGILKAGATYVPIDPEYPKQRINYMLDDSNVAFLLTQENLSKTIFDKHNITRCCLDHRWDKVKQYSTETPTVASNVKNIAYIIYTSGSTGKPKGVMVNHSNVINTLRYLDTRYPIQDNDAYLLKTNYAFDVSLSELFGWFIGGGHLVILPPKAEQSPNLLIKCIDKYQVTHINFVPSMLGVFVQKIRHNREFIDNCPLKYVFVAGEAFPKLLVKETTEVFPLANVENLYGPTEASIYSSGFSCSNTEINAGNTPIGKPLTNTQLYIVDNQLQPVPIGIPGELCIAGAGLAKGYLNKPTLTTEIFIDNPFTPGTKLYKTGDRVRWLTDGNIEYLGRTDDQVKIRGFRIELGEIENALNEQSGVSNALVLALSLDDTAQANYLTSYVVPEQGVQLDQDQLRTALQAKLPDYMVPSFFIILDQFPLTANGKIDKNALSTPDANALQTQQYVAPTTNTELQLSNLWATVLRISAEQISIHSNFFKLGGNSLLVVQVVSHINDAFDLEVSIRDLFSAKTIQTLALLIDRTISREQVINAVTKIEDTDIEQVVL